MGWLEAMRGAVMYQGNTLKLTALADGVVELTFDLQGESVNKFNARAVTELHEALDLPEQHEELSGVLITSTTPGFMVRAAIGERSEERRVGKEGSGRGWAEHDK